MFPYFNKCFSFPRKRCGDERISVEDKFVNAIIDYFACQNEYKIIE